MNDKSLDLLLPEQRQAMPKLLTLLGDQNHSCQIIEPTGAGKTYVTSALCNLLRKRYPTQYPNERLIFWLTPSAAVIQTQRVAYAEFGCNNLLVTSIDSMRSTFGSAFIEWRTIIENQEPMLYPFWTGINLPSLIILDEAQKGKNLDNNSQQALIIESAAQFGIPILFVSATPYSRPIQTKLIATTLRPLIDIGYVKNTILDKKLFPAWIRDISYPADPYEWSPAAMRRIQAVLEPYTVRWPVKYPHKLIVRRIATAMKTPEEERVYKHEFEEYQRIRVLQDKNPLVGFAAVLVALLKFLMCAERIRAPYVALSGIDIARNSKRPISVIFAFNYIDSADICIGVLEKEGIKNFSVIRGGQSATERQKNIDAFQRDKNHFMVLQIGAGGMALSLDHNQYNKRQRFMMTSPTWNDIQIAQLGGRTQRVKTQSASYLYIVYFSGTEDERQVAKMTYKCKALKEVTSDKRDTFGVDTFLSSVDTTNEKFMKSVGMTSEDMAALEESAATMLLNEGNEGPEVEVE